MNWLHKNKTTWRITFLILLVLAITGPWAYDRINVPSQYPCSLPNVRLDENFCGLPLSITWILPYFFAEILYLVTSQGSEAIGIADAGRQALFMVSIGLILLSPLSTLLILLFGDRKCGVLFHRGGLGLAAVVTGMYAWMGLQPFSHASWLLWGVWLYMGLTISMLILEILTRKPLGNLTQKGQPGPEIRLT